MKRILLLGYILFLLCGYTYSQQRVDPRYYPGVLINGIYWSEYNVDAPETFTDSPEGYGLFYYWNSKIAIPRIGNIDTLIWSRNDYWEEVNNPCPDGWRVPTEEEVLTLDDKTKVDAEYIQLNDINGWKFTDNTTKDSIFFPMAGFRDYFQNLPQYENLRGSYYTNQASRLGGYNIGFIFELIDKRWYPNIIIREARVASVRCVRERPPCDSIVRDIFVTICEKDLPYKFGDDTTFGKGTVSGTYTFHRIQALTGCDSIVHLHLTVAQEAKPCPGVLINGVCWARSNVDAPGTFAHTPEADGMLYQWNRKKGWSPTGDISGWDANLPSGDNWNKTNDPCPAGWRVPNAEEINTLLDESKVNRLMTTQTGIFGGKFTDKGNGNAVFFPVVNHRKPEDGSVHPGDFGYYWSASPANTDEAWALYCYMETAFFKTELPKNGGYSLRCVAGEDISDCKIVTEEAYDTICAHDLPYTWRDTLFYRDAKTGVYLFRRIQALTGCDSIVQLHLTVQDIPPLEFSGEVCQGENYNEYGFNLPKVMKDTIVCDTLKTRWGCDSIRILYLTVHPKHETIVYDTVCQGEPYHGYGFTLTNTETSTEGTITRDSIYKDIHGCDSLVTLNLFVGKSYIFKTEREICQGDTVMWRGKVFKESVIYDDSLTTVHGCDSVYRLLLTVHPVYDTVFPGEVCQGNDYSGHGFKLPAVVKDTIVRDTLKTLHGCDSICTLYLSVHPLHDTIVRDTACQGDDYHKHGVSLDDIQPPAEGKPLTPTLPHQSIHGCDSTVHLSLTVHPIYRYTIHDSICPAEPYLKHGFQLPSVTQSGTFPLHLKTIHGCDSTVTLALHVHPSYHFPRTEHICQGETFEFRDKVYATSGFYADTLATVHGCDSVYSLLLSVHPVYDVQLQGVLCEGEEYIRDGFRVREPGTHVLPLSSVHGCDSIVTLTLTEEKKVEGTIGFFLEDCTKHAYGFEFSPSLPVKEWLWDMGDGTTLTDGEGYHRYADSGSYRIQLHTLTPNGCGNDFYHVQRVPPYLDQVDIRADRKVIDEEFPTVRFRAEVLPGMVCEWDFGDGKTAQGNEVTHTYDASRAGMFEAMLRVTNEDGCVTESSIGIEAVVFPKAVNTFSPNGDGINDIFLQGFRIEVMNRNGLKIYNGENGWDGTYKGREAKEDTYFYRVTYRTATGERIKTGFVNLVR